MYSGVKTMGNGNGNSGQSGVNNNAYSSGDKTTNGYMSRMINTSTNNNNNFSNNTYQQQQQLS